MLSKFHRYVAKAVILFPMNSLAVLKVRLDIEVRLSVLNVQVVNFTKASRLLW